MESVGQKESLVDLNIRGSPHDGYRRRYCRQLVKTYRNLSFAGIPGVHTQGGIRLEDIFIALQASHGVPEVDVLVEEGEQKPDDPRRPASSIRTRETVEVLSAIDALQNNDNMVILGAPGSGKTTFMRYLALTFAQELSKERLQLDEDRLPILITIQDIAKYLSSDNPIADILSKHVNSELRLDLPDEYFRPYLEAGRCIVLFDGLDEVASVRQRDQVARKVLLFANRYAKNRCIVTSRIAGYREVQRFPEGDFPHLTIRDFDDDQIRDFAQKWYMARYPFEAAERTKDLVATIEASPRVRRLAMSPLMLTILAIIHRSRSGLPNARVKLYDLCTDALLFTWERRHRRPRLTDVSGKLVTDKEVRQRLEQLAYWMHSQTPAETRGQMHVRYALLKARLAEQLTDLSKMDPTVAEDEAAHFLEYIRENTGVLLERGTQLYAFVHLSFQEHFAACDIYRRCGANADKVWEEISGYLHDSHWRDVILLLVAKLDDWSDDIGEELMGKILEARTPYEDLLKRNLFLAGSCLAEDVTAEAGTCKHILDEIIGLAISSPYSAQKQYAADILRDLSNSYYKDNVMSIFPELLSDESSYVRGRAAELLMA